VINKLLQQFPKGYDPNPSQVKLLNSIDQAFNTGSKFVICNAPTGSGKSFISKTLGNVADESSEEFHQLVTSYAAYKRSQVGYTNADKCDEMPSFGCTALTITKALQDQYKELFNETAVIKGKSNYQCAIDERYPVDVAPCLHSANLKADCWAKNKCPYYEARNRALVSQFNTLNYNMFFALPNHLKKRQFLICDEASELEDQLVKEFTCKVDYKFLARMDVDIRPLTKRISAIKWLTELQIDLTDKIDDIKDILSSKNKTNNQKAILDLTTNMQRLMNLNNKVEQVTDSWRDSEYVYDQDATGITFMPLKVNKLAYRLFEHADKVILMSATIIDPDNFCKTLGIEDYKYVEAESTFDPKNAPIVCNPKYKLNYHTMDKYLPRIIKQVAEICNHHANDKGIIHTQNNSITAKLRSMLYGDRFLYREPGVKNEDILDKHMSCSEPTVLVSPSMSYGVDLKGDLAKFQILIKAPFLPTKDVRIERMMKNDFDWYQNKMLCSLIQACGRGVRSKKDTCITYILDGTIVDSILRSKHKLPKYFLERFV
jgi:ATP-dependent DNA helicase DinG